MNNKQQLNLNLKLYKLFDDYTLKGRWRKNDVLPINYTALEDNAYVILNLTGSRLKETYYFKKDAKISIDKSLLEYYENDLI